MIRAGFAHPLCAILIVLLAVPRGYAQAPPSPAPAVPGAQPSATPSAPKIPGAPLSITILEGNNVVNSIPLLRSTAVVVEVRDANDFPVGDATVTFTLPEQGPGGTFAQGTKTFSTHSDARGQAMAPVVVPAGAGKFQIAVAASAGDRRGEAIVNQTNSEGTYAGPPLPPRPWYKRKLPWVIGGAVVAAVIVVVLIHKANSNKTVVVTPGVPVFQ